MPMKAMLFAAGRGTRLYTKTKNHPKALVRVGNKTLLEHNLLKLKAEGFSSVMINVHHFAEKIIDFLEVNDNFGMDIQISIEMDRLLETGGGLQKASWYFRDQQAILLHNVDILSSVSLKNMMETHLKSGAMATLAVSQRESTRYLLFDNDSGLCAWENTISGEVIQSRQGENLKRMAFSGIHIVNSEIFSHINEQGAFSIIDVYLRLATDFSIKAFEHNPEGWFDVGTPEKLARAILGYQTNRSDSDQ